jgi:hypothetical protein
MNKLLAAVPVVALAVAVAVSTTSCGSETVTVKFAPPTSPATTTMAFIQPPQTEVQFERRLILQLISAKYLPDAVTVGPSWKEVTKSGPAATDLSCSYPSSWNFGEEFTCSAYDFADVYFYGDVYVTITAQSYNAEPSWNVGCWPGQQASC